MSNRHRYDENQRYSANGSDERYNDRKIKSSSSKRSKRDAEHSKEKQSKRDMGDNIIMTDVYDRRGYSSEDDNINKYIESSNSSNKQRDSRDREITQIYSEKNSKSYRNESPDISDMNRSEKHFKYNTSKIDRDNNKKDKRYQGTEKEQTKHSQMTRDIVSRENIARSSEKNSKIYKQESHVISDVRSKDRSEIFFRKDDDYTTTESDQDDDSKIKRRKVTKKERLKNSDKYKDKDRDNTGKNSKNYENENSDVSDVRSKKKKERHFDRNHGHNASESDQDDDDYDYKRRNVTEKEKSKHFETNIRDKQNTKRYSVKSSKKDRNENNDVSDVRSKRKSEIHFARDQKHRTSESDQGDNNENKREKETERESLNYSDKQGDSRGRENTGRNSKSHRKENYDISEMKSKSEKYYEKDLEYNTSDSDQGGGNENKREKAIERDRLNYSDKQNDSRGRENTGRNSEKKIKDDINENYDVGGVKSTRKSEKHYERNMEYNTSESDQGGGNKNKRGKATEKERLNYSDKLSDSRVRENTGRNSQKSSKSYRNENDDVGDVKSARERKKHYERTMEHNTSESDQGGDNENKRGKVTEREKLNYSDKQSDCRSRENIGRNSQKKFKSHRNENLDIGDVKSTRRSEKHHVRDQEYDSSESDTDDHDRSEKSRGIEKERVKHYKRNRDVRDRDNAERYLREEYKSHRNESYDYSNMRSKRRDEQHFETDQEYTRSKSDRTDKDENETSRTFEKAEQIKDSPLKSSDEPQSKRVQIQTINMRTGGAYIPPARLRMMQDQIKDKGSLEFQRIAWEALKKSIVGMTNKVNASNIIDIVPELFKENIIRGRGVLARAVMQAQAASPSFTRVYSALVAIINTKFPEIGELILKRLILQYRRGFRRNDKAACLSACRFIAHLFNQEVAHEIIILEIATHLLENPTEDSVEISIAFLKECGEKLTMLSKNGMRAITDRIRSVLHDHSELDIRVKYMIEVFFATQKDKFSDFKAILPELDLVEESDRYTHLLNLDEDVDAQDILNVFKFDPNYEENEEKYKSVAKEILGDSSDSEQSGDESDENDNNDEGDGEEKKTEEGQQIIDMTETNIVCLRRKIYLTIQSSLDFEECAHKLLKLELKPGQIVEMCYMILDCCAQQRTYEKFFGLLAQRFCQINKVYAEPFTEIFENSYKTIHRLETNKLRNVANFFAHLLYTDAISWVVLSNIRLNEEDTTSSSRVFIKILFQELCEYMGLTKLNERIQDVTFQEAFDGLFPRDHPHNTRFAINFFTSIGLGGLTDELREHLKNVPKKQVISDVDPVIPEESLESDSETDKKKKSKKQKKSKTHQAEKSKRKKQKEKRRRSDTPN